MSALAQPETVLSLWRGEIRRPNPLGRPLGGMNQLLREVARDHGIVESAITGPTCCRPVARARQDFMWRARQFRREDGRHVYSSPAIGRFLGGHHHTTILHGARAHQARLDAARAAKTVTAEDRTGERADARLPMIWPKRGGFA